jgi:hypothetical protein
MTTSSHPCRIVPGIPRTHLQRYSSVPLKGIVLEKGPRQYPKTHRSGKKSGRRPADRIYYTLLLSIPGAFLIPKTALRSGGHHVCGAGRSFSSSRARRCRPGPPSLASPRVCRPDCSPAESKSRSPSASGSSRGPFGGAGAGSDGECRGRKIPLALKELLACGRFNQAMECKRITSSVYRTESLQQAPEKMMPTKDQGNYQLDLAKETRDSRRFCPINPGCFAPLT